MSTEEPVNPEPSGLVNPEPSCPIARLFARICPEPPQDAADRILAGLDSKTVASALREGELERCARRAARISAMILVLGIAAAIFSLYATQGGHLVFRLHGNLHTQQEEHPELAGELALGGSDGRLLADPFYDGRK
jgi:hypothetical protein